MTVKSLFNIRLSPQFGWLEEVIFKWKENIDLYLERDKYIYSGIDAPYSSTERANISVLSGAVWRIEGGCALSEYTVEKESGGHGWGKSDLWLSVNDKTLSIEAKQFFLHDNKGLGNLTVQADQAKSEVSKIKQDEADQRMGLVFVTPKFSEKYTINGGYVEALDQLISQFQCGDCDLFSYYFPVASTSRKGPDTSGKNWWWPGVMLCGYSV